jgi:hypothetical protein
MKQVKRDPASRGSVWFGRPTRQRGNIKIAQGKVATLGERSLRIVGESIQLTNGDPSMTPELPGYVAALPFGAALGWRFPVRTQAKKAKTIRRTPARNHGNQ